MAHEQAALWVLNEAAAGSELGSAAEQADAATLGAEGRRRKHPAAASALRLFSDKRNRMRRQLAAPPSVAANELARVFLSLLSN